LSLHEAFAGWVSSRIGAERLNKKGRKKEKKNGKREADECENNNFGNPIHDVNKLNVMALERMERE
jgi:hypothetical protein